MSVDWVRPKMGKKYHAVYFGEGSYTEFYCGKEASTPLEVSSRVLSDSECCQECLVAVVKAARR